MKWVLMWAVYSYGAAAAEFDSQQACQSAIAQLEEVFKSAATRTVRAVCVPKS